MDYIYDDGRKRKRESKNGVAPGFGGISANMELLLADFGRDGGGWFFDCDRLQSSAIECSRSQEPAET